MAKRDRVLRGRATEGLGKAKSDILGAFAVAERMMGALDRFLSPQDEEDVADPEEGSGTAADTQGRRACGREEA